MKKNLLKRVLAIGLTVAMTLSLAACGGDKDGEEGKPGSSSGKGDVANAALAKENVYRLDPVTIPNLVKEKNGNIYVMDLIQAGEEFYATMKRSTNGGGENSPELAGEDDFYELFFASLE